MNIETVVTILIVVSVYEFGYKKYLASRLEKFIMLRMIKYWIEKDYSIQLGLNRYAIFIAYNNGIMEMLLVKTSPYKSNETLYSQETGRHEVMFYELRDFKNKCIDIIYADDAKGN